MQIRLATIITAGIMASIATVLFLFLVPSMMGMGPIDLSNDIGSAITNQSTRMVGTITLVILGILYSAIFANIYNILPGRFMTKGILYGIVVGLFSIYALPMIINAMDGMLGLSGQISSSAITIDTHFMLIILAYVVFGLTLATTAKPAETEA